MFCSRHEKDAQKRYAKRAERSLSLLFSLPGPPPIALAISYGSSSSQPQGPALRGQSGLSGQVSLHSNYVRRSFAFARSREERYYESSVPDSIARKAIDARAHFRQLLMLVQNPKPKDNNTHDMAGKGAMAKLLLCLLLSRLLARRLKVLFAKSKSFRQSERSNPTEISRILSAADMRLLLGDHIMP
ncbi:hypothetical protein CMV_024397 [Castanea mollissima]|uniref:Uncharacterized protein n=1 Tax=Castanea mollissima TaxID=60419 RepID=A0A8J4QN71_9ROSI|nr:hypothetical protein CMV_024397 [Castanea mollissima]